VFQLGAERFALPASAVVEITRVPVIHRLPFRSAVTGIVNVRGRIAVCVGLEPLLSPLGSADAVDPRLIVFQVGEWLFATRVDAVDGVHRLDLGDCSPIPPPEDSQKLTIGLWTLAGRSVAWLDEKRLFAAVKESLA
jgi:chemotaxis signal transduction protein